MFEDVKKEDVLNTLKNVDQNKQLRDTPYGLWFHSNTYSLLVLSQKFMS